MVNHFAEADRAWEAAAAVLDPEVPVLTIDDLGILRAVTVTDDGVEVVMTPTYSGCPAMETIREDVVRALAREGFDAVRVRLELSPAWTTDWISASGKAALEEFGIAPPTGVAAATGPVRLTLAVKCPQCGSLNTRQLSRFGSTSCKALYVCEGCGEPFDHFKAL
ncbi:MULTISPECIES: 1,2-phenylacetyl-CoA epoxidase subunit PaaD [unclassified Leifsonia]|uniref:1,2-phenylacetyl-CoA epoxidase subunit PaaD n=1 Tax=unclassified Leifsonia TaxID=2663824 RepID=UPI000926F9B0|nr:1,2-phenylacetyl-CoA epoxidase subunit PaaD [Leifsonia sp. 71-9]OJX72437.1 MAG: phenylacetate-CoA oxygenase subunit PaaJ [Leifsonia sp. 71-9]